MDVDAALSEVPVNAVPLIDDADFKSIEASVAYNAAGMALYWHFVTTAGAETTTQVTPTTGGNYDWAHAGQGMYTIEIPASGGASINNDTEGFGYFTGVATGVLAWRGPTICFRAAALNNADIDGGDLRDVNVTHIADQSQTARDIGASVLLSSGTGTGQLDFTSGVVKSNLVQILATALTETAGQIAAAFKQFFDVASPTGTMKYISRVALVDTTTTNTDMRGTDSAATAAEMAKVPKSDSNVTWNSTALASINAEADTALADYDGPTYTELRNFVIVMCRKDAAVATDFLSVVSAINADHGSGAGAFSNQTDALEALRDNTGTAGAGLTEAGGDGDHLTAINLPNQTMDIVGNITGDLSGSIGSLATQAKADVNAEVVDALATDTYAEPGQGTPAATLSLAAKINYLFKSWRNKKTQTSTTWNLFADDATTVDQKATVSDDATTATKGEIATGP